MAKKSIPAIAAPVETTPTNDDPKKSKTKFKITVEPALLAVFFAKFVTNIVLINLFLVRTCHVTLQYNDSVCGVLGLNTEEGHRAEKLVQPHTSVLIMWKIFLSSLIPASLSLFLGPWSDTKGRKPMMIAPLVGCSMMYMIFAGLSELKNLHPAYMLLGVLPQAFAGGTVNLVGAAHGYVSDITNPEDRSFRMSVLQGAIVLGLLLGLSSSSFIFDAAGKYGYLTIFSLASVTCMISFLYIHYWIPESVESSKDLKGFSGLNISLFKEMLVTCFKKRPKRGRMVVFLVTLSLIINACVNEGYNALEFLYIRLQYGWSYKEYSIFSSSTTVANLIGTIAVTWILSSYFKISDAPLAILACLSAISQHLMMMFSSSSTTYLLYGSIAVGLFRQSLPAFLKAILSKSVPTSDIGKVFALSGTMEAITPIAAGPIFTVIYNNTLHNLPGAYLLLSVVLLVICTFSLIIITYAGRTKILNDVPSVCSQ